MATDFFERQATARRNTWWLVAMFILAVVALVGATVVVATLAVDGRFITGESGFASRDEPFPWHIPAGAGAAALALIGGGSLYKTAQLAGGGTIVAERLGGKRVYPNTTDFIEKRLLNVVEEMALASGVPVPPVFLLDAEDGVNAFAAGFSPSDAVIGVTRGCADQLTREQLQGVIAHEFSHILNGDMRLNLRLIGVLHGILVMGLVGRELLFAVGRGSRYSSRRSNGNRGSGGQAQLLLLLVGLVFMVLGFAGVFFGNLIKAAVSRQREYLADSSAVQFTRNPEGIAGALKRIGAAAFGSRLANPNAAEASHMYFSEGVSALFATHPPLRERIHRLDPQWDGKFPAALPEQVTARHLDGGATGLVGGEARHPTANRELFEDEVATDVVERAVEHVGSPRKIHQQYVAELVASIPRPVVESVHEPYGARAVIYATLLDRNEQIRGMQLHALEQFADQAVFALTRKLLPFVDALDVRARLPLVDMSLPALRALSPTQYRQFTDCFVKLVQVDQRLGLFEWTLHQILLRHLRPQFEQVRPPQTIYYGLQRLTEPCSVLLSALAHVGHGDRQAAFESGARHLSGVEVRLLSAEECTLRRLKAALRDLARVALKHRLRLVDACAACICADAEVRVQEAELLRAVCDMLGCPMPPLLSGQDVSPYVLPMGQRSEV